MVFQSSCSHGAQGRKLLRAGHFPQETFRTNPQTAHAMLGSQEGMTSDPVEPAMVPARSRRGLQVSREAVLRSLGGACWPSRTCRLQLCPPQSPNAAAAAMALPGVASSQSPSPGDLKSLPVLKLRAAVLCCEDLRCLTHKTQGRGSTLRPPSKVFLQLFHWVLFDLMKVRSPGVLPWEG